MRECGAGRVGLELVVWFVGFIGLAGYLGGFWCRQTESGREGSPAPEVEGDGRQSDLGAGLGEAAIADTGQLHALLEGGEGGFDRGTAPGDQPVIVLEPGRQTMVPVGAPGQPRLDPGGAQPGLPGVCVIGRIGPHHGFIAADQRIGRGGVVDMAGVVITARISPDPSSTPTCIL